MKLDKKVEYYLRHYTIEFQDNYVLEILPQDDDWAVVLTAPKNLAGYHFFRLMTKTYSNYFGTIEKLADACVERGFMNHRAADKLVSDYHNNNHKYKKGEF